MNGVKRVVTGWRSRIAMMAVAGFVGLAVVAADAEAARRFGGGKSFGRQSQNVERQQTQPPARDAAGQAAPGQQGVQAAGAQTQPARNRWMGPLVGLAAGLGIFALLSALGLSGAFAQMLGSLLVVALLVGAGLFVWRMLRGAGSQAAAQRRLEPGFEAPAAGAGRIEYGSAAARPGSVAATLGSAGVPSAATSAPAGPWGVPADFDVEGFLRSAKVHFIRLQAAWDARNLDDIREFTTPEVFAEIRMQIGEEAATASHTDVVSVEAQLLGIEESGSDYIASVRFDGSVREEQGVAEPVSEVWNLTKPKRGNRGWLLAGIQQLQ